MSFSQFEMATRCPVVNPIRRSACLFWLLPQEDVNLWLVVAETHREHDRRPVRLAGYGLFRMSLLHLFAFASFVTVARCS